MAAAVAVAVSEEEPVTPVSVLALALLVLPAVENPYKAIKSAKVNVILLESSEEVDVEAVDVEEVEEVEGVEVDEDPVDVEEVVDAVVAEAGLSLNPAFPVPFTRRTVNVVLTFVVSVG